MTRVLPEPAPASTSTGPSVRTTACLCWGLRSERSSAMDAGVATAERPPEPVLILRRKRAWSAFRHAQAPSVPAVARLLAARPGPRHHRAAHPVVQGGEAAAGGLPGRRARSGLPGDEPPGEGGQDGGAAEGQ